MAGTFFSEDGWRDASASRVGRLFTRVGLRAGGTDLAVSYQRAQNHIEQAGSLPASELDQHRTRNFTRGDFFEPLMNAVTVNLKQDLDERWALGATGFVRAGRENCSNRNAHANKTNVHFNTRRISQHLRPRNLCANFEARKLDGWAAQKLSSRAGVSLSHAEA